MYIVIHQYHNERLAQRGLNPFVTEVFHFNKVSDAIKKHDHVLNDNTYSVQISKEIKLYK